VSYDGPLQQAHVSEAVGGMDVDIRNTRRIFMIAALLRDT
jgi:hypothetical protein